MQSRRTLFAGIALVAVFGLSGIVVEDATTLAVAGAESTVGAEKPKTVEACMKEMNRLLRRLKRQIAKPDKKADSLAKVNMMQELAVCAKGKTPGTVAKENKNKQAAYLGHYRSGMIELVRNLLELEELLIADKFADAKVKAKTGLKALLKKHHKTLKIDD